MNYWRWLPMLALVLLIAGISKSWLAAWLFYSLSGILVLAVAVAWRPAKLQQANRRMNTTHADIGQEVVVEVAITWERPISAAWVLARDNMDPALRVITPAGRLFIGSGTSQTSFAYRITATRRGYFPLGPLSISCGDLFGITRSESRVDERSYLTAYPKVLPVPPIRIPSNRPIGDVRTSRQLQDDPTRMVGVREYRPGDNLARIHWKATARSGTLSSKIFEPSSAIEVAIVLNMSDEDYPLDGDAVELACVTAASIAARLLIERDTVSLQSNGDDAAWRFTDQRRYHQTEILADRSGMQLPSMLALLGRLEPTAKRKLPAYLTEIHSHLAWTSTLLLITHRLSEEAIQALESLARAGFSLALIIVGEGNEATAAMQRAAGLNILTARVKTEEHLGALEFWRPGQN